ncbi:peptidase [Neorhizobium sp. NCHU2750]|nr:peptidase [Neorhizobium sp. NCHU2750]
MRETLKTIVSVGLFLLVFVSSAAADDWAPVEQVKTYTVNGSSGIELYSQIGEKGPSIGGGVRTIAYTDFKLLWSRKYEPQPDGACVLTSARPSLTLIYILPKAGRIADSMKAKWQVFADGVRRHERHHGEMIVEMVREIEAVSVGLSVPDDPKCQKIRQELTAKLGEISRRNRERHRDYDKVEMNDGGNVHQLILNLVNEGK